MTKGELNMQHIKITEPFDAKSVDEEYRLPVRYFNEKFKVKVAGRVACTITRKVHAGQTTIQYGREQYLIRGEGFDRFIQM